MEFNRVEIHLDKPDDIFSVRPIGDVHAGNRGFDKNKATLLFFLTPKSIRDNTLS